MMWLVDYENDDSDDDRSRENPRLKRRLSAASLRRRLKAPRTAAAPTLDGASPLIGTLEEVCAKDTDDLVGKPAETPPPLSEGDLAEEADAPAAATTTQKRRTSLLVEPIEILPDAMSNLEENVAKLLSLRERGRTINQYIGESPQFQNPYCLEDIMAKFEIEPHCSNLPKSHYDPKVLELWEAPRFYRLLQLHSQAVLQESSRSKVLNSVRAVVAAVSEKKKWASDSKPSVLPNAGVPPKWTIVPQTGFSDAPGGGAAPSAPLGAKERRGAAGRESQSPQAAPRQASSPTPAAGRPPENHKRSPKRSPLPRTRPSARSGSPRRPRTAASRLHAGSSSHSAERHPRQRESSRRGRERRDRDGRAISHHRYGPPDSAKEREGRRPSDPRPVLRPSYDHTHLRHERTFYRGQPVDAPRRR